MTFSLKTIVKKSTRIVAAFLIAMVLSGVTVHTHQPDSRSNKYTANVITTQITSVTYAAEEKTAGATESDAFITGTVKLLNTLLMLMYAILIPLISFAGWLLSPDWVLGDVLNLRPVLHNLWVLISNIVYVIFAFILIAMAFMNIFGSGGKAYELKSALPKLIVGIIMVPITWFIVSGTLSVTSVLTASVLQLPSRVIQDTSGSSYLDDIYVPNTVYVNLTGSGNYGTGKVDESGKENSSGMYKANGFMYSVDCSTGTNNNGDEKTAGCVSLKTMLEGKGAYSILFAYAYGIFNVQNFQTLTDAEIGTIIKNVGDLAIKLMFGVAVFLAFGFMVVALVVALITRAVHLWIYAVFSPVFALWHFFDGKVPGLDKMKTVKLSIGEFFGLAMVPVVVSAGLAFWLMILSFTMNATIDSAKGSVGSMETDKSWQSTFNIGWFKLISVGTINPAETNTGTTEKVNNIVKSLPGTGKSLIGKIIINIFALILLWMIVQAALSTSDITKKVVEPIFKFGADMAKAAPILPKGMGGSIGAAQRATQELQNMPSAIQAKQLEKSGLSSRMRQRFGVEDDKLHKAVEEVRMMTWNSTQANVQKVQTLLKAQTNLITASQEPQWMGELEKQLKIAMGDNYKHKWWEALVEAYRTHNETNISTAAAKWNKDWLPIGEKRIIATDLAAGNPSSTLSAMQSINIISDTEGAKKEGEAKKEEKKDEHKADDKKKEESKPDEKKGEPKKES